MINSAGRPRTTLRVDTEFGALRAEMVAHFHILNTYLVTGVVATGAVFSAAATAHGTPWLLLAPLAFLIPFGLNVAARAENILRISTYIQVFIEHASADFAWETRLERLRKRSSSDPFDSSWNRLIVTSIFPVLGFICVIAACLAPGRSVSSIAVAAMASAILLFVEVRLWRVPRQRSYYLRLWASVRQAEISEARHGNSASVEAAT